MHLNLTVNLNLGLKFTVLMWHSISDSNDRTLLPPPLKLTTLEQESMCILILWFIVNEVMTVNYCFNTSATVPA